MEKQFILRLHESIRHTMDLSEARIDILDSKSVVLHYKNKEYPGVVARLPCVVESQKTMDGKQYYKIADISTLVAIYPHTNFDFDRERELLETSGLTMPMKYVRHRRFKKRRMSGYAEGIETKIHELLAKDMQAKSVEVATKEEKEISDELDILAAEIETKLAEAAGREEAPLVEAVPAAAEEKGGRLGKEIEELERSIEEKRRQIEAALNPMLQRRFQGQLEELEKRLDELRKN
jgi:transcription initiation factor TFIID subunit 7